MPRLSKIGAAALAAFGWTSGSAVSASYLVVAGGGSGGRESYSSGAGGGGGAGGLLTGTASLNPSTTYTVTVGAGGAGPSTGTVGTNGSNSVFNTATSIGGGGGGGGSSSGNVTVGTGGSGGGGTNSTASTGGAGTSGQGSAGGNYSGTGLNAGGGGGASAVGGNGVASVGGAGGAGGAGTANSITGTSVTYAGGGGGSSGGAGAGGVGGTGGGGVGSSYNSSSAASGTANLGGGGGGGSNGTYNIAGSGGSGIVIISYVGAQQFSGGVVTSSGGNTIHTFTTSGTLGPVTPLSANYLVVAGGGSGGGGYAGGGGAGGLLTGSGLTIDPYSTYVVTVGAGGAIITSTNIRGTQGSNSAFSMVATAAVGGGGGAGNNAGQTATSGGSGGGGAYPPNVTGGAATSGQGYAGGTATGTGGYFGAGGGGAGAVGATGSGTSTPSSTGGNGGIGVASSISGTSTYYAGGGGGGTYHTAGLPGSGGLGGGGAGSETTNVPGTSGTANTGGGGGGGCDDVSGYGGAGGSGVVIISYAGSTQLMAGGVVTIAGGNVIHTFNSSGFLTPLTLLTRSLRFRSSASAYLNRTPSVAGNRRTFTWSAWVKRGSLTSYQRLFDAGASNDSFFFYNNDTLKFWLNGTAGADLQTTQVFRDPSAWYHIIIAVDTTQATSSNRLKLYINGVQVTSFSTAAYPTQNYDCVYYNTVVQHDISAYGSGTQPFDGYMAEVNFIDGQALAPTAFGTVNSYGVWQPITYGGSYGTNGFRLPFTNNASTTTLGYDFSPQGNNWTTNNISVTAGATYDSMTDVPTLTSATAANFNTLNPVAPGTGTISNANLTSTSTTTTVYSFAGTTLITTGKWYWEVTATTVNSANQYPFIGTYTVPIPNSLTGAVRPGADTGIGGFSLRQNGNFYYNGNTSATITTSFTTGDVIGFAFDADAQSVTLYKNNTSIGTQGSLGAGPWVTAISEYNGSLSNHNFGQRPFNYTPPTGYLALNTFNL